MAFLQLLPLLLGEKELDKEELFREIMKLKLGSVNNDEPTPTEDVLEKILLEVEADLIMVARAKKIAEEALKFQTSKPEGPETQQENSAPGCSTKRGRGLSRASKMPPKKTNGGKS